ncbi:MAG: VOC family protein [Actinomycetota bacterium]
MSILTWLGVPGDSSAWEALGFTISDHSVVIGNVVHGLGQEPSWGFDEIHGDVTLLGVPTLQRPAAVARIEHANRIDRIDHVVYTVPELDPAVDALTAVLGDEPRRRFHPRGPGGPEMAFYRVGDGFIEVVASGRPASLMGIAFSADDLDATVAAMKAAGAPVGNPKPAVQGGRIASVWRGHVDWGIAIMEPPNR